MCPIQYTQSGPKPMSGFDFQFAILQLWIADMLSQTVHTLPKAQSRYPKAFRDVVARQRKRESSVGKVPADMKCIRVRNASSYLPCVTCWHGSSRSELLNKL